MEFEWDPEKRETNLKKHGVDFIDAIKVFADEQRLEGYDAERSVQEDEDRYWAIGLFGDRILFAAFTLRGESSQVVRMISARKATSHERRIYYEGATH